MSKYRAVRLSYQAPDYKVYSGIDIEPIWLVFVVVLFCCFSFSIRHSHSCYAWNRRVKRASPTTSPYVNTKFMPVFLCMRFWHKTEYSFHPFRFVDIRNRWRHPRRIWLCPSIKWVSTSIYQHIFYVGNNFPIKKKHRKIRKFLARVVIVLPNM